MELFDRRIVKDAAQESLKRANEPHKVVLLHTGAVLLVTLILTIINYMLEKGIASTGGLSGMDLRAVLETIQEILTTAQMVLLPFWQIGYLWYCLRVSRGEATQYGDLLQGFRIFGPVLRLNLLKVALFGALALVCSYLSSMVFLLTPWAAPIQELMAHISANPELSTDPQVAQQLTELMEENLAPILLLFGLIFLPLGAPLFYRYRMAEYCLLDEPQIGALVALRESGFLMRGAKRSLLKLDLSFWWFYGLDALVSAVCYGDLILNLLGIDLGLSTEVTYFAFLLLYTLLQLGLYLWKQNQVQVTYAHVYGQLCNPRQEPQSPTPDKLPWQY